MEDVGSLFWQDGKDMGECFKIALDNQKFCDIMFVCGKKKEKYKAHRQVLGVRGSVFAKMFYGEIPLNKFDEETGLPYIDLPDIELDSLKLVLDFLYFRQFQPSPQNIENFLAAAMHFCLVGLIEFLTGYLISAMRPTRVCTFLRLAMQYTEVQPIYMMKLKNTCISFFNSNENMVELCCDKQDWYDASNAVIHRLIGTEELAVSETLLYKLLTRWAVYQCNKDGVEITKDELRAVLGSLIYEVRLPTLTTVELNNFFDELTDDEEVLETQVDNNNQPFPIDSYTPFDILYDEEKEALKNATKTPRTPNRTHKKGRKKRKEVSPTPTPTPTTSDKNVQPQEEKNKKSLFEVNLTDFISYKRGERGIEIGGPVFKKKR